MSLYAMFSVMGKLREYLKANGKTFRSFGQEVDTVPSHLSDMDSGRRTPGLRLAVKISRATDGHVPVSYWVDRENTAASGEPTSQVAMKKSTEEVGDAA